MSQPASGPRVRPPMIAGQADHGEDGPADVEPVRCVLVAGLGDVAQADPDHHRGERDVDEEDPPPGRRLDQPPAEERADRGHDPAEPGPRADRGGAVLGGEARLQDREAAGREQRGTDPLQRAGGDERSSESARPRTAPTHPANHATPSRKIAPPAVPVAERAAEQEEAGERQRVGVHDPLQAREPGIEVAADRRQRDVDDGRVERGEAGAEHGREQHPSSGGSAEAQLSRLSFPLHRSGPLRSPHFVPAPPCAHSGTTVRSIFESSIPGGTLRSRHHGCRAGNRDLRRRDCGGARSARRGPVPGRLLRPVVRAAAPPGRHHDGRRPAGDDRRARGPGTDVADGDERVRGAGAHGPGRDRRDGGAARPVGVAVERDGAHGRRGGGPHCVAVFGADRPGFEFTDVASPDVPPPEECPSLRDPLPEGVEPCGPRRPSGTRSRAGPRIGHPPWEAYEPVSSERAELVPIRRPAAARRRDARPARARRACATRCRARCASGWAPDAPAVDAAEHRPHGAPVRDAAFGVDPRATTAPVTPAPATRRSR